MLELQPFDWDVFQHYEAFKGKHSPIANPEVKNKLAKYYKDHNRDLLELTGVDYLS